MSCMYMRARVLLDLGIELTKAKEKDSGTLAVQRTRVERSPNGNDRKITNGSQSPIPSIFARFQNA
jgi:hypothetical protein